MPEKKRGVALASYLGIWQVPSAQTAPPAQSALLTHSTQTAV
jgi:hypothetical protein